MTDAGVRRLRFDVGARPFLVLVELTRACDLACSHCRAESTTTRDPAELSTPELLDMLDDLAALGPPRPHVVFTGGDPLRRPDLARLVRHAAGAGLAVAVSPAGTPRASRARLGALRRAGASAVSFSIDGAGPASHDAFRRVPGSFDWTVAACRAAQAAGLRLQVNTTVSAETVAELPGICHLVADLGANLWSVFFLVPVGRGRLPGVLSAPETEDVLRFLWDVADLVPLKTTEAPAYRRLAAWKEQGRDMPPQGELYAKLDRRLAEVWPDVADGGRSLLEQAGRPTVTTGHHVGRRRVPLGVGDGKGVVFVSSTGDVQPSGFLPLAAGNVRRQRLTEIYSGSPLLTLLRSSASLGGRCGRCEWSTICGGSRAQAFARTGNPSLRHAR